MIQVLGEHLKVKQQVISTAIVYFKRFYLRNSFKSIDPLLMCPTCIFLASKVEEFGVISNNRLTSTCQTVIKNKFSYAYPNEFPYRMNHVLECEFYLLELMDCCLILYHPYRPLVQYMQDIKEYKEPKDIKESNGVLNNNSNASGSAGPKDSKDDILNISWSVHFFKNLKINFGQFKLINYFVYIFYRTVANDTYRTDIPLLYPPHLIAIACLHVACVIASKETYKQWFAELNVDFDKVLEITRHILNLYEMWKSFDEKKEISALLLKMPTGRQLPNK